MASFFLDVFRDGGRIATLTIDVGQDKGWYWGGAGFNTGGDWQWHYSEDKKSYFISLISPKGLFADLGDWPSSRVPDKHPPRPWFSQLGKNSGTVFVYEHSSLDGDTWRLQK